jgi:hypothetical protein
VRADHLDEVVWDHITGPLVDTQLIRTEIDTAARHPEGCKFGAMAVSRRNVDPP